jgi:hypothetical protein
VIKKLMEKIKSFNLQKDKEKERASPISWLSENKQPGIGRGERLRSGSTSSDEGSGRGRGRGQRNNQRESQRDSPREPTKKAALPKVSFFLNMIKLIM